MKSEFMHSLPHRPVPTFTAAHHPIVLSPPSPHPSSSHPSSSPNLLSSPSCPSFHGRLAQKHLSHVTNLRITSNNLKSPPRHLNPLLTPSNPPLSLSFWSNTYYAVDSLPLSLTHLTFGGGYNRAANCLPLAFSLMFGTCFNHTVDLPVQFMQLSFGISFNQPVDSLPSALSLLTFGVSFNQPTPFLSSLTHLIFWSLLQQTHSTPALLLDLSNLWSLLQLPTRSLSPPPLHLLLAFSCYFN